MRVLYVDDNEILGVVVTRLLRLTAEVVYLSSAREARELLLQGDSDFDLIVSDVMMPEETGPEFHQWLSKSYPDLSRKVVFMTGGCNEQESAYIKRAGVEVIIKPNVERLLDLVRAPV